MVCVITQFIQGIYARQPRAGCLAYGRRALLRAVLRAEKLRTEKKEMRV